MTTSSGTTKREQGSRKKPFGDKKRLFNVVPVQFRTNTLKHDADARELNLRPGDDIIIDTQRGPTIARVMGPVQRKLLPNEPLPRVLRKANVQDLRQADTNEKFEQEAYRFGIERIRARKLSMKLVRAHCMQDGSKLVLYFSAEGRVDFRDLVKDLAHHFRMRIEMHQIGVRDGTRMLGGIGPCGRELCCSTFLKNFEPVSIRMAKDQGLTLNPKKVSGMCGRLMCCLVYEQQVYRRMRTRLPRAGQKVETEKGPGEVLDVDVINRRVTVSLADRTRVLLGVDEVRIVGATTASEVVDEGADLPESADYIWDEVDGDVLRPGRRRSKGPREAARPPEGARPAGGRNPSAGAPRPPRPARSEKPAGTEKPPADASAAPPAGDGEQLRNEESRHEESRNSRRRRGRRRGEGEGSANPAPPGSPSGESARPKESGESRGGRPQGEPRSSEGGTSEGGAPRQGRNRRRGQGQREGQPAGQAAPKGPEKPQ